MAPGREVVLWRADSALVVPDTETRVTRIVKAAKQLRDRERTQITSNFDANHFEVVTTFIWHKTMTLLKKQLATLGNEFISELLQRPDIDERTDITSAVSEAEAIRLARDLGILTATQCMRLTHSQEVVNHFASVDSDDLSDGETMTREEALSCLRVCVQSILGHDRIKIAEDFAAFRRSLETVSFSADSPEIVRLVESPYFFVRTAISVLLSVLRAGKGAQLEHVSRNALLIVPLLWSQLKKPERWQVGQAYAAEFSEGKKESVKALHAVLLAVKGFDYVPENLRSNTFSRVASSVISAHQGMNNFYNEPGPTRELANLGSSIPGPALAQCMTAVLCVKLGNQYGVSWNAQEPADEILRQVSHERWIYYLNERLENDLVILPKLSETNPRNRWMSLVRGLDIDPSELTSKDVRKLIVAAKNNQTNNVSEIAMKLYQQAV